MNEAIEDEVTSINAIYSADTLRRAEVKDSEFILTVPFRVALHLLIPPSYPANPPVVLGPESAGRELRKGEANDFAERAREAIKDVFQEGQPCVFDLLEELTEPSNGQIETTSDAPRNEEAAQVEKPQPERSLQDLAPLSCAEPRFFVSEMVTEKRSAFVARAAQVETPEQARFCLDYLRSTDKKAAKVTHNMTAWRIRKNGPSSIVQHDCDDDGEAAAGGRLLHLLELMGAWNVIVIVSRWFGGTLLGPDRFRIINEVARDALLRGGFVDDSDKTARRKCNRSDRK